MLFIEPTSSMHFNSEYLKKSYTFFRSDKNIFFEFKKNTVEKRYCYKKTTTSLLSRQDQVSRYYRALAVYLYFSDISWEWSPKLLAYNVCKHILVLERITAPSLFEYFLEKKEDFDIQELGNKLLQLEKDMIAYHLNIVGINMKDILYVEKNNDIYLLDFEDATLQKYQYSLFLDLLTDYFFRKKKFFKQNCDIKKYRNILIYFYFKSLREKKIRYIASTTVQSILFFFKKSYYEIRRK